MEESINASTPADDDSLPSVVRGNRTKRQRLQLPPLTVLAGGEISVSSTSSAQFSGRITTTTADEEEEDIANCLILLAMGRALETPIRKPESKIAVEEAETAVKLAASAAANGKTGFYVYECKTCNKCFPSFQALGGHRVSHKKPKLSISSPSPTAKAPTVNSTGALEEPTDSAAGGNGKGKRRIHVCSICGVKFTSGQALGGHMRRHRPASHQEPAKKEKSGLSVDLNLPAPSDEDHRSFAASPKSSSDSTAVFPFTTKTPLLLLPPALIDCHY